MSEKLRARRLRHPLWVHLPAGVILGWFVGEVIARVGQWPAKVPLQVGWDGHPTSMAAPWVGFALTIGLSIFFIGLSVLLDELWARQETAKRWNPFTLLDELIVGLICGLQWIVASGSLRGAASIRIDWGILLPIVIGGTLTAGVLEVARRASPSAAWTPRIDDEIQSEVAGRLARGERFIYWDVQNPPYVGLLSIGLPTILLAAAIISFPTQLWVGVLLTVMATAFVFFYGGQRVRVTSFDVEVRYGIAGIRVLRLPTAAITSVAVEPYAPLRDFGGYGIRVNRTTTAYYLRGGIGVRLAVPYRRDILIGSDHPQRLAAVLAAVSGAPNVLGRETR